MKKKRSSALPAKRDNQKAISTANCSASALGSNPACAESIKLCAEKTKEEPPSQRRSSCFRSASRACLVSAGNDQHLLQHRQANAELRNKRRRICIHPL